MTTELPAPLREAVDRIEEAPAPLAGDPAAGALGRLDAWWETVSGGDARPVPHEVSPSSSVADPTEPGDRRIEARLLAGLSAADRAVDSGATVIVTAAPGDDVPARAVIALLAWREASTLLPQPPGTSDAEWMRRCARVRDVAAAARSVRADTVALLSVTQADDVAPAVPRAWSTGPPPCRVPSSPTASATGREAGGWPHRTPRTRADRPRSTGSISRSRCPCRRLTTAGSRPARCSPCSRCPELSDARPRGRWPRGPDRACGPPPPRRAARRARAARSARRRRP